MMIVDLLKSLVTLGTSTTATPGARDATPAGKASFRDALLALLVTGIVVGAASQGIPISEDEATRLLVTVAGSVASIVGAVQLLRRKVADRTTTPG